MQLFNMFNAGWQLTIMKLADSALESANSSAESDSEMNLGPFYNTLVKKVNIKIYSLRDKRKYISFDIAIKIYEETILPFFDCGVFLSIARSIRTRKRSYKYFKNYILQICNKS